MLLILLSDQNGEAFNIGNDEEVSIGHVASLVDELFNAKLSIHRARSEEADYLTDSPDRRCPDLTKMKSVFQWQPQVSLRDGLSRTIRWHQEIAAA